jgi:uncharacterized DUF497 family protein
MVQITFDPKKQARTFEDRGLDFRDAQAVFDGPTVEMDDVRRDYGERRIICYGILAGRMVVIAYAPRGAARHIISMRKANERERTRLGSILEIGSQSD